MIILTDKDDDIFKKRFSILEDEYGDGSDDEYEQYVKDHEEHRKESLRNLDKLVKDLKD